MLSSDLHDVDSWKAPVSSLQLRHHWVQRRSEASWLECSGPKLQPIPFTRLGEQVNGQKLTITRKRIVQGLFSRRSLLFLEKEYLTLVTFFSDMDKEPTSSSEESSLSSSSSLQLSVEKSGSSSSELASTIAGINTTHREHRGHGITTSSLTPVPRQTNPYLLYLAGIGDIFCW